MAFEDLKLKTGSAQVPIKLDVVKETLLMPPFTGLDQWICFANGIPISMFMSDFDLKVYLEYLKQGDRFAQMPMKLRKLFEENHQANHRNLKFGQDGKIKG